MIQAAFNTKKPIFIPFIMAGHPTIEVSYQAIMTLNEAGVGMIELGVPFSDPVADGPVNQHAAEIALSQGVNLQTVLDLVERVRADGCMLPIILFTYYNPILAYGEQAFTAAAKQAGINGILIVDLPPEEGATFYQHLTQAGLGTVLLLSPTTNPARYARYQALGPAFLYYISRLAVTGVQQALAPDLVREIQQLRAAFPSTKLVVGFGISTPEQVKTVASCADGVVVGSHLVKTLEEEGISGFKKHVKALLKPLEIFS